MQAFWAQLDRILGSHSHLYEEEAESVEKALLLQNFDFDKPYTNPLTITEVMEHCGLLRGRKQVYEALHELMGKIQYCGYRRWNWPTRGKFIKMPPRRQ